MKKRNNEERKRKSHSLDGSTRLKANEKETSVKYYSQRFNRSGMDSWDFGSPLHSSLSRTSLKGKMQEKSWMATSLVNEEIADTKMRASSGPTEVKEDDSVLINDPNTSMWRGINGEHQEIEERPKDQSISIRNYYKERWLQEHKEQRTESITSQAVKILSEEPPPSQITNQSPHEASIYHQLAHKLSKNPKKDGRTDKGEPADSNDPFKISRRISAEQFSDDEYKDQIQESSPEKIRYNVTQQKVGPRYEIDGPYVAPKFNIDRSKLPKEKNTSRNASYRENAQPVGNNIEFDNTSNGSNRRYPVDDDPNWLPDSNATTVWSTKGLDKSMKDESEKNKRNSYEIPSFKPDI